MSPLSFHLAKIRVNYSKKWATANSALRLRTFLSRHVIVTVASWKERLHMSLEGNFPTFASCDDLIRNACNWILSSRNRIAGHGR